MSQSFLSRQSCSMSPVKLSIARAALRYARILNGFSSLNSRRPATASRTRAICPVFIGVLLVAQDLVADVALRLDALVEEEALLLVAPLDVLEVDLELEQEDLEMTVELVLL